MVMILVKTMINKGVAAFSFNGFRKVPYGVVAGMA